MNVFQLTLENGKKHSLSGLVKIAGKENNSGRVAAPEDVIAARLSPLRDMAEEYAVPPLFPSDRECEVFQTGMKGTSGRLCNALFSPGHDCAVFFTAEELILESDSKGQFFLRWRGPLTAHVLNHYYRDFRSFGEFTPLDRSIRTKPVSGWCSWYSYYQTIDSRKLRDNVDFLSKKLRDYGLELIQLDDGWQGRGSGHASNRDFFTVCLDKFPEGMRAERDYIVSHGFEAGLWCIPFFQSASPDALPKTVQGKGLYLMFPDGVNPCLLQDAQENAEKDKRYDWGGMYCIDATTEAGKRYLKELGRMIASEWGFSFIKIDASSRVPQYYRRVRSGLNRSELDGVTAYRSGLKAFRKGAGKNARILNCAWGFSSCSFCDALRTGPDITVDFKGLETAANATFHWLWLNNIAFFCDPDVLCVRDPLTFGEARLWTTMLCLTGQQLLLSDFMPLLPEERLELLRRVLPVVELFPMELYPVRKPSNGQLIACRLHAGKNDYLAVGALNFSPAPWEECKITPEVLGLDPMKNYAVLDFWEKTLVHSGKLDLNVIIPPHDARTFGIFPITDKHPCWMGSSRHLTMGATDVIDWEWREETMSILFRVMLTAKDVTEFYFYCPSDFKPEKPLIQRGKMAVLKICSGHNETRDFIISFHHASQC